jgi:hypothetical protein
VNDAAVSVQLRRRTDLVRTDASCALWCGCSAAATTEIDTWWRSMGSISATYARS